MRMQYRGIRITSPLNVKSAKFLWEGGGLGVNTNTPVVILDVLEEYEKECPTCFEDPDEL